MADSPGSSLSSLPSEDFAEEMKFDDPGQSPGNSTPQMPPSKRRRTGGTSSTWDHPTPISSVHEEIPPASPTASISSDSSTELPNSPTTLGLIGGTAEDDYSGWGRDQVTVCQWDGCNANDLGHMDALVKHIHEEHVGSRQKKYLCEWKDCSRKGQTHASGYALRAHMRSHTKEKPFYCILPECDRSFTRSDALSKHIRTVHEMDPLRSTEMGSKHHGAGSATTSGGKLPRIKLKLSQPPKEDGSNDNKTSEIDEIAKEIDTINSTFLGPEIGFDDYELSLPLDYLYRLLRRQIHWAEQEQETLKQQWESVMGQRKAAWRQKEGILDDVIVNELRVSKSGATPEDFGILGREVAAPPTGGDSTVAADSSFKPGDTAADSGQLSRHNGEMDQPGLTSQLET